MIFEQKKIQTETLSEYLTQVRSDLQLSREQVVTKTTIQSKFLAALENGQFQILPADIYVYDFLKQLASLYSIDVADLISQYKKEKNIQQKLSSSKNSQNLGRSTGKLVITPKLLSFAIGIAFVAISVIYIIWQIWSINKTPSLQIYQPQNNSVISASFVQVSGKTDPGMTVAINGQNIFVDGQGGFQAQIGLNPGPEQINITAANRFGKTFSKSLNVIDQSLQLSNQQQSLQLKLDFDANVTISISVDDQPTQNFNFNAGDSKTFSAQQKIIISTSDAGATKITLNGQSFGAMGRSKEALTNIPFFAPSASPTTTASSS